MLFSTVGVASYKQPSNTSNNVPANQGSIRLPYLSTGPSSEGFKLRLLPGLWLSLQRLCTILPLNHKIRVSTFSKLPCRMLLTILSLGSSTVPACIHISTEL